MHPRPARHVRIAAHAELISLIVMLANLFTVHLKPVSSLMGPTHGCAYLFVVIATWRLEEATTAAKSLAVVPGVGGLLALRRLDTAGARRARLKEVIPS
ncbi:DUF3817 domain-containing protein [Streptomyces misionensis]|uniref:DUF3817 domain-containing protein n=1 Tax=Streptomyces misionensis TaxID=67331 RepID=A0A5C6JYG7_9ACTN|nr:DUF3817 domain-containing protein [Streptomyces misionensis]TWV53761.1 DUF3817 domain-containing protein [Streptomyces misionensis]